jgi:prepilin-type N-terminal cleavage/methylation domain-containing protein
MLSRVPGPKSRKGFTLVELAVVIVIIGVLAAFGVPRFLKSVEKSKASEAFGYLAAVRSAQERYLAQNGTYADDVTKLDIQYPAPKYFDVGTVAAAATSADGNSPSLQNCWSLTLTRKSPSGGYGNYTVIFTDQGFDAGSSIVDDVNPVSVTSATTTTGS